MEAIFWFGIAIAFTGAALAWFHRRTFFNLLAKTALATLVVMTGAIITVDGLPEHYSPTYLLHGLAYFVVPYVLVLVPGIAAACLAYLIRRKLRPRIVSEPPVTRQKD